MALMILEPAISRMVCASQGPRFIATISGRNGNRKICALAIVTIMKLDYPVPLNDQPLLSPNTIV